MSDDPLKIVEALKASRAATAKLRTVLVVAVLAIVIIFGLRFYNLVDGFDSQRFAERFTERASMVAPGILAQTGEAADRLIPVYAEEVTRQADRRLVDLHLALMKEYETLLKDVDLMTSTRGHKLTLQITKGIEAALSSQYPVFATDMALRDQARDAILMAFEGAAQDALNARVKRPGAELKRLITATSAVAVQANQAKPTKKHPPEMRMVLSLLGLVSRELANQRARLIKEVTP